MGVTKVCHLLNQGGTSWNEQLLERMFSQEDVEDIKQIVVGGPGADDHLAWNFTKDGYFTVCSAYHLRVSMNRARTG